MGEKERSALPVDGGKDTEKIGGMREGRCLLGARTPFRDDRVARESGPHPFFFRGGGAGGGSLASRRVSSSQS